MPASQAAAAERRNDRADESFQVTNEPPKLRTTLKTPPKQATNPLQFVKVGPCSLYRTAQEQLSKVQEVKKVKQEVRDDPEDWQSNLDNWKSSRRKRQEHIIERVVEAKKLEEEEHTRQRRKGKTFSEMIEERGNRGRKLSISLNMFNDEEGSNELSDLGTGVGSNKSSISGDTHDDNQSIFSDRDNEMEKNQSDLENTEDDCIKEDLSITKKPNYGSECDKQVCSQTYESTISDENKSSESEEYTYEGAIRTYVSRVSQNIPRNSAVSLEAKFEVVDFSVPPPAVTDEKTIPVKVNILKRREIFEKASQMQNSEVKVSNKLADVELVQSKSIKERLTNLEKIKSENDKVEKKNTNSGPKETSTVRELLSNLEKQETVKRNSSFNAEELENVLPLKERLLTLREYEQPKSKSKETKLTKEDKPEEKGSLGSLERDDLTSSQTNEKYSMPSDEYELGARISRSQFHRSLDSLDEDASSRPDSYERVQSLEELDYQKYDTFTSSNEILNDTDREDSGIHTTDVSWSVSQTDESVDDGIHNNTVIECVVDDKMNYTEADARTEDPTDVGVAIDGELISAKTSLYKENNSDEEVNCRRSSTESTGSVTSNAKSSSQKVDSIKEQMIERPTSLNLMSTINKESIVPLMNSTPPVYTNQMLPLSLSSDEELLTSPTFPLGPPTSMDPPKEKPPPPPTDLSDDENRSNASLKRLNSTRRIKQELRSRRSDFLGIEGTNDEELERELTLSKPPDMAAILAEERRIDQLHCRSYDTDSNYDQDSSHERDSGVELGHVEDWTKQPISPDMSQHSRQSSEPFGASITSSEEDELQKKEQEIIDVLEKEEQWRYRNEHNLTSDIADKFGHKVIGLEKINVKLEREREKYGKSTKEKQEESTTTQQTIKNKEEQPVQKEFNRVKTHFDDDGNLEQKTDTILNNDVKPHDDEFSQREIFRVEQELLQLEQEELKRQRTHMALKEQKQQQQLAGKLEEQWKSRQEEENESKKNTQQFSLLAPLHYRTSMPNLQTQEGLRRRPPPPPPILPSKPLMLEQHREYSMRNNRIPSADSIPQQVNASLRHSASVTSLSSQSSQQMTRQTLQALSAVPRSRIVQGDQWVQRRKSDTPRGMHDCNYQHWLIQEAEQRRISEVNQKSPSRKCQQHVTGTSVLPPATSRSNNKPLPESIIRTLTQRVQNRVQEKSFLKRRFDQNGNQEYQFSQQTPQQSHTQPKPYQPPIPDGQDKVLSVSGKKKCSHCGEELGRGAAMIIESLRLFYHMECFKCCVCHIRLGDGLMGTDVRVRNHKLHCHNCYSSDDGTHILNIN